MRINDGVLKTEIKLTSDKKQLLIQQYFLNIPFTRELTSFAPQELYHATSPTILEFGLCPGKKKNNTIKHDGIKRAEILSWICLEFKAFSLLWLKFRQYSSIRYYMVDLWGNCCEIK